MCAGLLARVCAGCKIVQLAMQSVSWWGAGDRTLIVGAGNFLVLGISIVIRFSFESHVCARRGEADFQTMWNKLSVMANSYTAGNFLLVGIHSAINGKFGSLLPTLLMIQMCSFSGYLWVFQRANGEIDIRLYMECARLLWTKLCAVFVGIAMIEMTQIYCLLPRSAPLDTACADEQSCPYAWSASSTGAGTGNGMGKRAGKRPFEDLMPCLADEPTHSLKSADLKRKWKTESSLALCQQLEMEMHTAHEQLPEKKVTEILSIREDGIQKNDVLSSPMSETTEFQQEDYTDSSVIDISVSISLSDEFSVCKQPAWYQNIIANEQTDELSTPGVCMERLEQDSDGQLKQKSESMQVGQHELASQEVEPVKDIDRWVELRTSEGNCQRIVFGPENTDSLLRYEEQDQPFSWLQTLLAARERHHQTELYAAQHKLMGLQRKWIDVHKAKHKK